MDVFDRVEYFVREWRLHVERSIETETSVISFVRRDDQSFVLKVVRREGDDEWHSGEILKAFKGCGVVRVYQHAPGAMLLERLQPGTNLVSLALDGRDEESTNIIASVMASMSSVETLSHIARNSPTVEDWGKGFARYLTSGDETIARELVESAQRVCAELCASQKLERRLHGDLQHYNVLFDSERGWLAIDPKGVIGELEYEVGAMLRNPFEAPDLFLSPATIKRRIDRLTTTLNIDRQRVIGWAFSQAVLSAIWQIEDGFEVTGSDSALKLAVVLEESF